ncbi:MAG: mandelate racemase/muconate lactonizing enzyme family protein [Bilifractor sp.]
MKLVDVTYQVVHIPMKEPFRVAFAEITATENVLVKLTTEDGLTGYGEASPFGPVTGETTASVCAALDLFRQGLIGMDAMDIEGAHAMMDRLLVGNTSAKCAIDLALYDLVGKAMGQPLYKVLGGGCPVVENDITIGIDSPKAMAEKASQYVQDGFSILKVKIGLHPEEDVKALKKIREVAGEKIRLRADANQGYDTATAIRVLEALRPIGVEAMEQPLPSWNVEGHAEVRSRAGGIKIMLDESLHSPQDAMRAVRSGAADVLNIKLMKCGGLYPALQIASIAKAAGLTCMVGCMMETKIAITAGISLVASRNNITDADCDSFLFAADADMGMPGGFVFEGSRFTLSDKPGLGLDISL